MEPGAKFSGVGQIQCEITMQENGSRKMLCSITNDGVSYPIVEMTSLVDATIESVEMMGDAPEDVARGFWKVLFNDSYDRILDYSNRLRSEIETSIDECECHSEESRCNKCTRLQASLDAVPMAMSVRVTKPLAEPRTISTGIQYIGNAYRDVTQQQNLEYRWINTDNNFGVVTDTGGI